MINHNFKVSFIPRSLGSVNDTFKVVKSTLFGDVHPIHRHGMYMHFECRSNIVQFKKKVIVEEVRVLVPSSTIVRIRHLKLIENLLSDHYTYHDSNKSLW